MRKLPILFSAEMVRAMLREIDPKTQTRRVLRRQPPEGTTLIGPELYTLGVVDKDGELQPGKEVFGVFADDGEWGLKCPWRPGDLLYVREGLRPSGSGTVVYLADGCPAWRDGESVDWAWKVKKLSGLYMPKWAARIWLEVVSVRVQRVQEATDATAFAEGYPGRNESELGPLAWFVELWDLINLDRGYGWSVNPFVWALEFKRVERAGLLEETKP